MNLVLLEEFFLVACSGVRRWVLVMCLEAIVSGTDAKVKLNCSDIELLKMV